MLLANCNSDGLFQGVMGMRKVGAGKGGAAGDRSAAEGNRTPKVAVSKCRKVGAGKGNRTPLASLEG